jgi:hypothetical protein
MGIAASSAAFEIDVMSTVAFPQIQTWDRDLTTLSRLIAV